MEINIITGLDRSGKSKELIRRINGDTDNVLFFSTELSMRALMSEHHKLTNINAAICIKSTFDVLGEGSFTDLLNTAEDVLGSRIEHIYIDVIERMAVGALRQIPRMAIMHIIEKLRKYNREIKLTFTVSASEESIGLDVKLKKCHEFLEELKETVSITRLRNIDEYNSIH